MKTASVIAKVLAALATIAGIVYIVATYGDKIVAWAKKLLNRDECECCECEEIAEEEVVEAADEDAVEASDADFEG